VRDLVLGREPADYDVATDAEPEEVMRIFPETYAVGAQFGVVLVPLPEAHVASNVSTRNQGSRGHAGTVESDDLALLVNGTLSTMRALKMLPGDPHPIENPVWLDKIVDVTGEQLGIFYPLVKRGAYVEAGMKLGYVTDFFGKVIAEPRAPVAGVILHVNALPTLKKGDNIANIGVVASHAP